MITLHQLRIFWAAAHAKSLTKASKLVELTQPSLSQQITKLEDTIGTALFKRDRNQMELTEAGKFLLRKAEVILAGVDEALAGLKKFNDDSGGGTIAVGALNSIARCLLPRCLEVIRSRFPELQLDIHEVAPAEAIDLLYGRRLTVALLASESIASSVVSFHQVDVVSDPYVLAVPPGIDLSKVRDLQRDVPAEMREVLNNTIHFSFGTQHALRMEQWYRRVLPHYRVVAQTRTYDMALSLVEAGAGVAVVPALAARNSPDSVFHVNLYRLDMPDRRVVALMPSQYARVDVYAKFIEALRQAGREAALPPVLPEPPFIQMAQVEVS